MLQQYYLLAIVAFCALGMTLGAAIIYIVVCPRKRKKKSIKTSYGIGGNRNAGAVVGKGNTIHNHAPMPESATLENDNVYRRMCRALDAKDREIELKNAEIELKNKMIAAREQGKAFRLEEMKRKNKELDRRQQVIERKDEDIKDLKESIDIQSKRLHEMEKENRALHNQLWEHVRTYMAPIKAVELERLLGEGVLKEKEGV